MTRAIPAPAAESPPSRDEREEHGFGDELGDDAPRRRAERQADGDISRCLPDARARRRFAMFTDATRMISVTAAISTRSIGRMSPTSDSWRSWMSSVNLP